MSINISARPAMGIELTGSATGSYVLLGTLTFAAAIIIFDNQGTGSVQVSTDGVNTWRTFTPGEALVLDMRAAHGAAPNFSFSAGTPFYIKGAGTFSISYVYATGQ